ncbi:MAG TPA: MFS transporter, partial [Gaiellales bacterium]|nr:MFS transporter [Gaiellales bacterium]
LRLAQGLAGAVGIVISRAVVRDLYEGRRMNQVFSQLMLVTGLAPVVAPLLGAQLLHVMDWRGLFVVLALIGAAIAAGALLLVGETLPASQPTNEATTRSTFATILRDRHFVLSATVGGGVTGVLFAYISASPFVVEEIHGASAQVFSVVFAVNSAGIILAGQLNTRLVDRFTPTTLLRASVSACAVGVVWCLVAAGLEWPLWVLLPGWMLAVAQVGIVMPNCTTLALAGYGHAAGAAAALLGTSQFLIGAVASPLVGVAGSDTALPMALLMTGCVAIAASALVGLTDSQSTTRVRRAVLRGEKR